MGNKQRWKYTVDSLWEVTLLARVSRTTERWLKKESKIKRTAEPVLIHHQKHSLSKKVYQIPLYPCSVYVQVSSRHFAAATKPAKKTKKSMKDKASDEKKDEIEKIKSYSFMEGEPEDDVYLKHLYPRQIYEVEKAIQLLKKFQTLDFTNPKQGVYLDLTLDMSLGKKILDDEIQSDFYVAVPEIMPELNPLKKKLKKRFPKLTRNSIGRDIPKMLELFKTGHEIKVDEERENFLETKIATLDMQSDQIAANLQAVISEVCKHRPLNLGPFVVRAFLRTSTSEGLLLKIKPLLPKEVETEESNKEDA
ncbi:39S ribosomal protein L1, mitochondrial isoform X5 [Canis lupus familiaris]|uniref:39S ribosomal protein L1, mitochondrial isoform X5 n=1 Tax=Canis lupus familiaris TaxID=9615 RepID=UPI0018F383A5|nr:39S ribosomal protein L1, mitochondrial isoform X5 [Canis lupus familiaris]XP_038318085.1 39S ribosomal protein L1, mitochondrial isoform X5 [Canis lupus familiaris]